MYNIPKSYINMRTTTACGKRYKPLNEMSDNCISDAQWKKETCKYVRNLSMLSNRQLKHVGSKWENRIVTMWAHLPYVI